MWVFWILAIVPIGICGLMMFFNSRITWQEWCITTVVALIMAGLFQLIAGIGMTRDVETWSGYATQSRQYSSWEEYYEYAVYRTVYYYVSVSDYDSHGHRSGSHREQRSTQVFDHWEPTTRWHDATWGLDTTLGNIDISEQKFNYMCQKFNDHHSVQGDRTTGEHASRMIGGDPNDYVADNKTSWIEPVTTTKTFENRIKAAPSLFSYSAIPTNIAVYPWPNNSSDVFRSDRVMGTAKSSIDTLKWDQMNAVLGASKKINLIIIGFGNQDMNMSYYQESSWVGGKKNDLVICYGGGGGTNSASWCRVFGWTEKNIVKEDIATLFLDNPINNDLIPKIAAEVNANYVIKDWHKFDYITIEPPTWSYWVYIITLILVQGGLFFYYNYNAINNSYSQDDHWAYNLKPLTSRIDAYVGKKFPSLVKPKKQTGYNRYYRDE